MNLWSYVYTIPKGDSERYKDLSRYCVNINWHGTLQNVRTGMQYQAALSQNLISPKIGAGCVLFEVIIVIGDKKSTASYHCEHPSARYTKITACWDYYCLNKVDQQWLYTPRSDLTALVALLELHLLSVTLIIDYLWQCCTMCKGTYLIPLLAISVSKSLFRYSENRV